MSTSLVAFDTDRIKRYVFATGQLRDIRGASALLDWLNRVRMSREVLAQAPDATMLYAHGGSGLFQVETSQALAVRQAVERLYRSTTSSGSISSAQVELSNRAHEFQQSFELLSYRLRASKDRPPPIIDLLTHGLFAFCAACGVEPATDKDHDPEGGLTSICRSCAAKRNEDRQIRQRIAGWLGNPTLRAERSHPVWRRLIVGLRQRGYRFPADAERPRDFGALGEQSTPSGYIGLVYADGDGIGAELERLDSAEVCREFAVAVDDAMHEAVMESITAHLPLGESTTLGFDVLLLGGDDVVLVTRAQAAIEMARTIVQRFSDHTRERLGRPLRMTACVVLAHAAFPFAALRELAESGVRFAKQQAAERRRAGEHLETGLVNFLVVSSAAHLDFSSYMEQDLRVEGLGVRPTLVRTLRPYTPEQLDRLLGRIRELVECSAPLNKLQQVRQGCFLSYHAACIEGLAALLRWPEHRGKQAISQLVYEMAASVPRSGEVNFPWFRLDDSWLTPLVDLVELYEFIPARGGGDDAA